MHKILIIGPAWVGDMMMAHTLFQLLHQQNPGCVLHVLAPAWSQALLSRMPGVDKSITLPFGHKQLRLYARYRFAKQLRTEKYDQAIVLPNSFKSALIPYWAHIPTRTGFVGEQRYGLLNDIRPLNKKALPQMVARFAALAFAREHMLAANLPIPQLRVTEQSVQAALLKFTVNTTQKILALCPGAEYGPAKCWPAKYYASVAQQKLSDGWCVLILGSPNDAVIAEEIQTRTQQRCVNLTGKTTLAEAVDLLSVATYVVANDSGLMHIAAALRCFVIALYGSTSPNFAPPLSDKSVVLTLQLDCQPCGQRACPLKHHHCMEQLLPKKVLDAIK
jgi:heptosyltransferase-2